MSSNETTPQLFILFKRFELKEDFQMNVRGYQLIYIYIYDKELSRPIWGFSWQRNKNKKRGTNLLTTSILTILFLVFCQSYFLNTYFFMPNLYFNLSFCCLCFTMYRAIFVFSCNYKGIVNRAGKRVFFFFLSCSR